MGGVKGTALAKSVVATQIFKCSFAPCGTAIVFLGKGYKIVFGLKDSVTRLAIPFCKQLAGIYIYYKRLTMVDYLNCSTDDVVDLFCVQ